MTFEETKEKVLKDAREKLSSLVPTMRQDVDKIKKLFESLEAGMKEEDTSVGADVVEYVKSLASNIKMSLILNSYNEDDMSVFSSLNSVIYNFARLHEDQNLKLESTQINTLISTRKTLNDSIDIMRVLIKEAQRIQSFEPKDFRMSGMFLETIDQLYEEQKQDENKKDTYLPK